MRRSKGRRRLGFVLRNGRGAGAPRGQFKGRAGILGRRAQGKAGEFLGEDRGFGCAGEGDESDSGARAVSGWRARAGADALGPGGRERARLRRAG